MVDDTLMRRDVPVFFRSLRAQNVAALMLASAVGLTLLIGDRPGIVEISIGAGFGIAGGRVLAHFGLHYLRRISHLTRQYPHLLWFPYRSDQTLTRYLAVAAAVFWLGSAATALAIWCFWLLMPSVQHPWVAFRLSPAGDPPYFSLGSTVATYILTVIVVFWLRLRSWVNGLPE